MPALPGNEGAIILVTPNRFARGEREHVARSTDVVSAYVTPLR
jgi:hypothetical protein